MHIVVLKTDGGKFYTVRCRDLVKDTVLPDNLVLVGCMDPIPSPFGLMETDIWSVHGTDIASYMKGQPVPPAAQAAQDLPVDPPTEET